MASRFSSSDDSDRDLVVNRRKQQRMSSKGEHLASALQVRYFLNLIGLQNSFVRYMHHKFIFMQLFTKEVHVSKLVLFYKVVMYSVVPFIGICTDSFVENYETQGHCYYETKF